MIFDPFETQEKQRMKRARALIKAKRFAEARDLLQGLENATAQKWIARLDEILVNQDDPFSEPEPEPELSRSVQIPRRKTQSNNRPLWTSIAISVVVIAVALFLVLVYLPGQDKRAVTDDMKQLCQLISEDVLMDCDEFAKEAADQVEQAGVLEEVKVCFDRHPLDQDDMFQLFALMDCLDTVGDVQFE